MELKNILAATDFSDGGTQAARRAALLAREHGATLHLLHVVPKISWAMFGRALLEHPLITEKHLYDAARTKLEELAAQLQAEYGAQPVLHVDIGNANEQIGVHARKCAADLTILGPHAQTLAGEFFIGSTARRFLHQEHAPALIAHRDPHTPYRNVLVACDFSDASRTALRSALAIAPDASIHVLHAYEVLFEGKMHYAGVEDNVIGQYRDAAQVEARNQMQDFLDEFQVRDRVQTHILHGSPSRILLDQAQTFGADLIVMGKRSRSDLDELFLGSVTEYVLQNLDRDLLLITS